VGPFPLPQNRNINDANIRAVNDGPHPAGGRRGPGQLAEMGAAATSGVRGGEVQARHAEHPVGMREDVQLFGGGVRVGRSHAASGIVTWPEKLHRLVRHFVRDHRTDQATEDKKQPPFVAVVPDHEWHIVPGAGGQPGPRVGGGAGDDRKRFHDARARKNYSGQSPITRALGKKTVVLARYATNRRLGAALHAQAFSALVASPGARAYYDALRARKIGHHAALRQLANRSSASLHGCLKTGTKYDETTAWQHQISTAA